MIMEHSEIGSDLLRIGEVARRGGVRRDTLRYYERRGLLTPAARSPGGYRLYDESAVARLEFIRNAATLGLTLEEIGGIIELASSGASVCSHVRSALQERVEQVDEQIEALVALRRTLSAMVEHHGQSASGGAGICGIINRHVRADEGTPDDDSRG